MRVSNRAVFLSLLALQLVLVWAYPRFATQDGPSHLYNAAIIGALRSGSWSGVSSYFRISPHLVPNWTTYFLLVELMKVFSAATAEKILVSIYIVLFAFSFWWVSTIVRPGSEHFLIWGLVLGSNWFLSMGFYNFCFGLVFFLLCFGYWVKWRKSFGIRQWLTLFLLAFLLYFTHLFCFLMAAFLIALTGSLVCLGEVRESGELGNATRRFARLFFSRVAIPELCFVVFLLLSPFGAISSHTPHAETGAKVANVLQRSLGGQRATIFDLLVDRDGTLTWVFILAVDAFLIIGLYWALARSRERASPVGYGIAAFSAICILQYFFGPSSFSGKGDLKERVGWFALWGAFAFLASKEWGLEASS